MSRAVARHDVKARRLFATIVVSDIHATDEPVTAYARCNVCPWRSRVYHGNRGVVMHEAKQAYRKHKPPWWSRWFI